MAIVGNKSKSKKEMKLYLISTKGLGEFYLISSDLNEAEHQLMEMLNKADYGFSKDRKVLNIQILAEEITEFPAGTPNFSSANKLIISK